MSKRARCMQLSAQERCRLEDEKHRAQQAKRQRIRRKRIEREKKKKAWDAARSFRGQPSDVNCISRAVSSCLRYTMGRTMHIREQLSKNTSATDEDTRKFDDEQKLVWKVLDDVMHNFKSEIGDTLELIYPNIASCFRRIEQDPNFRTAIEALENGYKTEELSNIDE